MGESRQAWDKVGEDLTELGHHVKRHYQERPEKPDPVPAEGRKKVDEALRQLTASLDNAFTALGDAVRDPEFGQHSKQAAASLTDALSVTFSEVSERIRARQDKGGGSPPPADYR
jgi:hypothetical protein